MFQKSLPILSFAHRKHTDCIEQIVEERLKFYADVVTFDMALNLESVERQRSLSNGLP